MAKRGIWLDDDGLYGCERWPYGGHLLQDGEFRGSISAGRAALGKTEKMTTAGREIAFVRILWLLLAGAVYYYLVHRPIDHFWAFAAMLPFYIKIVYSGLKSSDARPGLDAAKGRMVEVNNTLLVPCMALSLACALAPKVIPIVLAFVLVADVVGYLSPGVARAILRGTSWIPEMLRA